MEQEVEEEKEKEPSLDVIGEEKNPVVDVQTKRCITNTIQCRAKGGEFILSTTQARGETKLHLDHCLQRAHPH